VHVLRNLTYAKNDVLIPKYYCHVRLGYTQVEVSLDARLKAGNYGAIRSLLRALDKASRMDEHGVSSGACLLPSFVF
jgi:hypothetical protein